MMKMNSPCDDVAREVPDFLADTIATTRFNRRAGEWDLDVARVMHGGKLSWLSDALALFLKAFPWASIEQVVLYVGETRLSWNRGENRDVSLAWMASRGDALEDSDGFEARMDLCLSWTDPWGESGSSKIPDAARLVFDRASSMYTFTIWPNFFTDRINLYERNSSDTFQRLSSPFQDTAQANRFALAVSLKEWEALTGGSISSYESELVDGIEKYGFAEHALPR